MLNAIDGFASAEGRILVATTNVPSSLDAALTREGRFDLKLHIGYMENESFQEYLKRFYPNFQDLEKWHIKDSVAPCKVQALVFQNKDNPLPVLEAVAYLKNEEETSVPKYIPEAILN